MPVRRRSDVSKRAIQSLASLRMARISSSSASKPARMKPPSFVEKGGSSTIALLDQADDLGKIGQIVASASQDVGDDGL